jgi:phosphatidylglycerophosphate synthase
VRSGAHVGTSQLRKLYWARPLSLAESGRAAQEIQGYDEDRVLLDSAVKASDGFFTTFFVSPYSRYIARWAARRGLTPNQVTTVSLLIGALAAAAFATGERWGLVAGAVLLQLAFTTDCVDGQLARYTRTFSKLGAWLDSIFDRAKEYMAFAGLAIGASRAGDPVWALACCALTLQTVRHMSDFSYGTGQHEAIGATSHPRIEQPGDTGWVAAEARRAALAADPEAPPPQQSRSLPQRVLRAWHVLDRVPGVRWVKKMIAFPIGERFAAISLTAALWTPRVTFTVLLAWGGIAFVYSHVGRVLRSISR